MKLQLIFSMALLIGTLSSGLVEGDRTFPRRYGGNVVWKRNANEKRSRLLNEFRRDEEEEEPLGGTTDGITGTFNYEGSLVTITNLQTVVQHLIDQNVLNYGKVEDGNWVWNSDFDSVELVRLLVQNYGYNTSFGATVVAIFPQLFKQYPDLFRSPTAMVPTQTVSPDNIENIIDNLFDSCITNYGKNISGQWIWNADLDRSRFSKFLVRKYGYNITYWLTIIDAFPQIFSQFSKYIENKYSPIVIPYKGTQITVTNPWLLFNQFNQSNILQYYEVKNDQLVWKNNVDKTKLANYLLSQYGNSVTYWLAVIDYFPKLYSRFVVINTVNVLGSIRITYDGKTYVINDPQRLFNQLNQSGILAYLKSDNGNWFFSNDFNYNRWANNLVRKYGNDSSYWLAVFSTLPTLYPEYLKRQGAFATSVSSNN